MSPFEAFLSAVGRLRSRFILTSAPPSNSVSNNCALRLQEAREVEAEPGLVIPLESLSDESSFPRSRNVVDIAERWNYPRSNVFRILATFWSLMVMGASDAVYGAIIPYLGSFYNLSYSTVSLVFLSPFIGYISSAILNNVIHYRVGRRGVAVISSGCHVVSFTIISMHPPYPALVATLLLTGFGNGLSDAAWNAWVTTLSDTSQLLGFLHGSYGVGGVISPLVTTLIVTKSHLPWYTLYYFMTGISVIEFLATTITFWPDKAKTFRLANPKRSGAGPSRMREAFLKAPSARASWLCCTFLLAYLGLEVALGGWIVTFMLQVRNGSEFASGMTATGFWLGLTLGRMVLGFVNPMIGERLAVVIYVLIAMGLELLLWLVPQLYVSAVAVSLQGFIIGPFSPSIIGAMTKLLPPHLHVSTIGFGIAVAGAGGALLPFAIGAMVQAKGVQVLPPIVLAVLAFLLGVWLCLPRFEHKEE